MELGIDGRLGNCSGRVRFSRIEAIWMHFITDSSLGHYVLLNDWSWMTWYVFESDRFDSFLCENPDDRKTQCGKSSRRNFFIVERLRPTSNHKLLRYSPTYRCEAFEAHQHSWSSSPAKRIAYPWFSSFLSGFLQLNAHSSRSSFFVKSMIVKFRSRPSKSIKFIVAATEHLSWM